MPIDYIYYYSVLLVGICLFLTLFGIPIAAGIISLIEYFNNKRDK